MISPQGAKMYTPPSYGTFRCKPGHTYLYFEWYGSQGEKTGKEFIVMISPEIFLNTVT